MNPTRLFVLGALAKRGPMYGHQLRRNARLDRADLWSDVRPGSLYGALHRLAAEGLIEPLRTEQDGNLPARTVYAITGEGLRELKTLRAEALAEVGLRPDPVDLALAMSADLDEDTLRGFIEDRIRVLGVQAAQFSHLAERAWPDQTVADDLVAEHTRLRLEAELTWHRLLLDRLGKLTAESEHAASAAGRLDQIGKLTAESEHVASPVGRLDQIGKLTAVSEHAAALDRPVATPASGTLAAGSAGSEAS